MEAEGMRQRGPGHPRKDCVKDDLNNSVLQSYFFIFFYFWLLAAAQKLE